MLRPSGEKGTAKKQVPKAQSVTQAVILKIQNSRRERPCSAAARPEFGFISLKG
jgi:hypothetical protein